MTEPPDDQLNVLAPRAMRPKFDYLHREVQWAAGMRLTRREALGLGGLALLAAACGATTTTSPAAKGTLAPATGASTTPTSAGPAPSTTIADPLAGKTLENHLEIYNWSQYDDPSTYTKFKQLSPEAAAGLAINETYYSSNDELLAKLHAGATGYDIVVPSQNAVAQMIEEGKLMALDKALLPNLKNLDPAFLTPSYDPTGAYHVIKDFGITMIFYNNKIVTDHPKTMHDFYGLLTKYSPKGRTNILDGAEEVVPLALMALGIDPNTTQQSDFDQVKRFMLSFRKGVTTISSSGYINDAIAGKIILSQGWNGDVRRIVQGRQKQGDITPVILNDASEIWADNWCILASAPHPVAAHAWIDFLLTPSTAVTEMEYHNYPIPIPDAVSQVSADLKNDPMFNVPKQYTDNYHYILNVSPQVVQARTAIYTEFKAGLMAVAQQTPPVVTAPAVRPRRRRSFTPRYPAWLTSPSLLYYAIFFLGPMAILLAFSLATQAGFGSIRFGFDTSQYGSITHGIYFTIFERTLVMAAFGSLLTIAVGYPVAYWMARYLSTYKMLALLLVVVPFWTSFLIRTYALKIILDPQGYLAKNFGINIMYTKYAVGLGLVYNYLPLFILPVFASLERMDWTLIEAATDLGASPLKAFREITLPLTLPGVVTGALLVFIPMTGEYIIPNILGGGRYEFVGNLIGDQFGEAQNQPFGSALAIGLMIALSVFVLVYIMFATKEERFGA